MVLVYSPSQQEVVVLSELAAAVWQLLEVPRSSEQLVAAIDGGGIAGPTTQSVGLVLNTIKSQVDGALRNLRKVGLVHP